jgi:hypothetical protein
VVPGDEHAASAAVPVTKNARRSMFSPLRYFFCAAVTGATLAMLSLAFGLTWQGRWLVSLR